MKDKNKTEAYKQDLEKDLRAIREKYNLDYIFSSELNEYGVSLKEKAENNFYEVCEEALKYFLGFIFDDIHSSKKQVITYKKIIDLLPKSKDLHIIFEFYRERYISDVLDYEGSLIDFTDYEELIAWLNYKCVFGDPEDPTPYQIAFIFSRLREMHEALTNIDVSTDRQKDKDKVETTISDLKDELRVLSPEFSKAWEDYLTQLIDMNKKLGD